MRGSSLRYRRSISLLATLALFALASPLQSISASAKSPDARDIDTRSVGSNYNGGRPLPLSHHISRAVKNAARANRSGASGRAIARIGQKKIWLGLDDEKGILYPKVYKLRGRTKHMEVWVAAGPSAVDENTTVKGTHFLPGDCRNDRIKVTDAQIRYFMKQFENNMYPTESQVFSKPPRRNGSGQFMTDAFPELNIPRNYYKGGSRKIVTLVDNVRDDHFYDIDDQNEYTYIAGFFYSTFNEAFDHNVMTIDSYDWLHRTHGNPPNEPVPGDPCASKPARPYLYEGVFAHEYQHLLEYYEDTDEVNWINEGLSDYAASITGYFNPKASINEQDFASHIQCFLGYIEELTAANPNPRQGGPENSLTAWGDQAEESEILCDYGAASSFMEVLAGRYGTDFMTKLHKNPKNGLDSLQRLLDVFETGKNSQQVVHEWAALMALDGIIDDGATLHGGDPADYQTSTLNATINWDNDDTYSTPGAPPNGSDYVRLRNTTTDAYMTASQINKISFNGEPELPALPIEWEVDETPPGGSHADDPALYSGSGPSFDRSIVTQVDVPAGSPTLSFETRYNVEPNYDFGFVQVSTDGGETYTSLSNEDTTSDVAPDSPILDALNSNTPGFTGKSGGGSSPKWVTENFDLSAYAGQNVLLAFRYITDSGVDGPGWWIDDVKVNDTLITDGTSLAGFQSQTEVNPTEVSGFTVQLVAYDADHSDAWVYNLPLDGNFDGSVKSNALTAAIGTTASTVAAIVTYDEPTETVLGNRYAPYTLEVDNKHVQPGGHEAP
jgi:hypothetical protein